MATTPTLLQRLAHSARRHETPCAAGRVVWHSWGETGAAPLILLHGGSGSWTHWVRNIEPLQQAGWQLWVPDMPGFGDSDAPPDGQDADALVPWLEAGAARLLGHQAVPVVGFSFGGLVGGLWAAAEPARASQLVLVGAPGFSNETLTPLALRAWETEAPGPAREAAHRHNLMQLMLAHASSADALAVHIHGANVERDRLRRRRLMRTDLLLRTLPQLRCRVDGLWGALDFIERLRPGLVARSLPQAPHFGSLQLLPDAGHWVSYEAAEAFNAALLKLLGPARASPYA
ncbi:MAG: alpha/beta fold hydrolase [Rubrivivax sp.]|nr:alpha/beta fold hydrolase [Rubrivivax sp.]